MSPFLSLRHLSLCLTTTKSVRRCSSSHPAYAPSLPKFDRLRRRNAADRHPTRAQTSLWQPGKELLLRTSLSIPPHQSCAFPSLRFHSATLWPVGQQDPPISPPAATLPGSQCAARTLAYIITVTSRLPFPAILVSRPLDPSSSCDPVQ